MADPEREAPDLGRLLRTVAHLRPAQIAHRIRLRARRAVWERTAPRVDARYRARARALPVLPFDHPGLARLAALRVARTEPDARRRVAEDALAGRFSFLNRSEALGSPVAWHREDLQRGTRLWKTYLHEFPYAVELAQAHRETGEDRFREGFFGLVESWQRACPIGQRGFALDAWNARAVVSRMLNWSVAGSLLGLRPGEREADGLSRGIALHAVYLRDNLEWDLLGNHLLRDAVGLVFANELLGVCPDALRRLRVQVDEQVLADGCHVERSPLYHAVALQDLVEVRTLLGDASPDWLCEVVARMAGFLAYLLHGDGDLPLFGDGWRGELDPQRLLAEAGGRQPAPREPERHSGLLALRRGETCAVFRAGPHGPDYQLGHAHGDLLSFEVSHGAARIVTDTGTGAYDAGPVRARIRSTRAHNTLAVDEQEQLEAWGSFRVGRRGRARVLRWGSDAHCSWIWAAHDAYRRLPGRPVHHRLLAVADAWVLVLDAVLGAGRHRVASHVHLHPRLPSGTARVVPLGAACGRRAVPLYERFGETQEMAELFVEAGPELPWAGGWLIQLAPAGGEPAVLAFDGRTATARYGSREGPLRARWTPLDPADPCPFELRLCDPVPDSASEARLC